MSLHQIIYTSCMRGIDGVNDGQQVFSYDSKFTAVNNDEIKRLFTYQPPALPPGVIMTEELATTMPQSFTYRKIDEKTASLTLNTYLGRDYMGSAGRFGNHLSHVVVFDSNDLKAYPCEYYKSTMLRERMEFEEVNNPNKPDYLPVPSLEKGFLVDVDSVIDFLSIDNRLEAYKDMLYAMLSFEQERKRLVICDEQENIIMWIAALEYALPLKNIIDINFSTYDYNPSLSASQICGVVSEGTRFDNESSRLHFVFDFKNYQFPSFDKENDFYDFIDTAFSLSYESLRDFHDFLDSGYLYSKADTEYYAGYKLYSMLLDGLEQYSYMDISKALDFCDKYATPNEVHRVILEFISNKKQLIELDISCFLVVCSFIAKHRDILSPTLKVEFKNIIIDKTLVQFISQAITENEFATMYARIEELSRISGFSISKELMLDSNRAKLLASLRYNVESWKVSFIIHVVSEFAKQTVKSAEELSFEAPLGRIYFDILNTFYSNGNNNDISPIKVIIDEYADNCEYLLNMALNIEGILMDVSDDIQLASMWKYFVKKFIENQEDNFDKACRFFDEYERYEQIYMIYYLLMEKTKDAKSSKNLFNDFFDGFVLRSKGYRVHYFEQSIDLYYKKLQNYSAEASREAKIDLFDLVLNRKLTVTFADELVDELMKDISLSKPSREDARFIKSAFAYTYNINHKKVSGKLLLLLIGMVLEDLKSQRQLREKLKQIDTMSHGDKADLTRVSDNTAIDYFEWVIPSCCDVCHETEDMDIVFSLFSMSRSVESAYFSICTKQYLKICKEQKDYSAFCEYLGLVFEYSTSEISNEVGKSLCKLNKQKMSELDEKVKEHYRSDKRALRCWDEIRETAESTNPILNNIGKFFRRRKG